MNNSRARTFILFFLVSFNSVYARAKDININVKFDQTFYSVNHNSKFFVYKEGPNTFSIPIKKCNKVVVGKIINQYESLLANYKNQKKDPQTAFDVTLLQVGGETLYVSRGSALGSWLRDFPKQIMYQAAEAQVLCKK